MKKFEIVQVYNYIYRQRSYYEEELRQSIVKLRYRSVDINDLVEIMLLMERLNSFKEFSGNVLSLLRLAELDEIKPLSSKEITLDDIV